jgi:hypothetical protein
VRAHMALRIAGGRPLAFLSRGGVWPPPGHHRGHLASIALPDAIVHNAFVLEYSCRSTMCVHTHLEHKGFLSKPGGIPIITFRISTRLVTKSNHCI